MATSFKDFVKQNATGMNLAGAALGNIGDLTGEGTKLKGILKTLRDMVIFTAIWKTTLAGAFIGLSSVVKNLARDIGSIDAAMKRLAAVKFYSNQLAPLVGGIAAARSKLADLTAFSKKFNLPIGEVVAAQRALIIFGKGALVSGESLDKVRGIARAAGVGIDQAAMAYAGFHQALAGGAPVEDASRALAEMGVVSAQAVREARRLQETGGSVSDVMKVIKNSMDQASSAASDTADQLGDLEGKLAAAKEAMSANFGKNFLASEEAQAKSAAIVIKNLTPVVDTLGRTFAVIAGAGKGFINFILETLTAIPGLSTAVGFFTKVLVLAVATLSAFNVVPAIKAISTLVSVLYGGARALNLLTLAYKLNLMANQATMGVYAQTVAGNKLAAFAYKIYAAALHLASTATAILGNASLSAAAKVKALTAAMLTSPLFVIALFLLAAAALWQYMESCNAAAEAMAELNAANKEVSDSLARQIHNIKTMSDAQDALAKSTSDLPDARKKLAQMKVDAVARDQRRAQEGHIKDLEAQQKQLKKNMKSGAYSPGSEQEKILQEKAGRDLALALGEEQFKIDNTTGSAKTDLLRKQQENQQKKAQQGQGMAMARADMDTANAAADTGIAGKQGEIAAEQIGILKNAQNNNEVKEAMKDADEARKKAGSDPKKTVQQADQEGREELLSSLENRKAESFGGQAGRDVDEAIYAVKRQIEADKKIAKLEEDKIKNRKLADDKNELMAEQTEIEKMPVATKEERDARDERRRLNTIKVIDIEKNQAANEQGAKEKAQALKVREAENKINTIAADSSQERLDAQVSADRNKMVAIDDRDRQVAKSRELQATLGISAPEADKRAAAFSASSITLEDRQDRMSADAAAAVSSMAKIGGGGGVEATATDMLSLARRTAAATEATAKYLAEERAIKEEVTKN